MCYTLLKAQAIEEGSDVERKQYEDFLEMYDTKWNEDITTVALRTIRENKRNKGKHLPLSADIARLSQHLERESEKAKNSLRSQLNTYSEKKTIWNRLAALTLTRKRSV